MADEVQRRIAADGLDDLRFADGVVFQHLVPGAIAVSGLAARRVLAETVSALGAEASVRGRRVRPPR